MTVAVAPRFISRSADHHYTFDGVTYPGVTSVLKVLDKSGPLMAWAAKQTAMAAVEMAESLPAMLASIGPEGVAKALTSKSAWKNEEARLLGTEVHNLADMLVTGQPLPAMSEAAMARVDSYDKWWRSCGWKVRVSEALLVNPTRGYGGTLDLLCYDENGQTVLADIKTGNVQYAGKVYDEIVLQLAAYGMAEWAESDGALYRMPAIDRYAVVHVTADKPVEVINLQVGEAEQHAFIDALRLHRWVRRGKK